MNMIADTSSITNTSVTSRRIMHPFMNHLCGNIKTWEAWRAHFPGCETFKIGPPPKRPIRPPAYLLLGAISVILLDVVADVERAPAPVVAPVPCANALGIWF